MAQNFVMSFWRNMIISMRKRLHNVLVKNSTTKTYFRTFTIKSKTHQNHIKRRRRQKTSINALHISSTPNIKKPVPNVLALQNKTHETFCWRPSLSMIKRDFRRKLVSLSPRSTEEELYKLQWPCPALNVARNHCRTGSS